MQTAKVFWSGRSQAVRLPKEFRFDVKQVLIRREGDAVIVDDDFVAAALEKPQIDDDPPWLDYFA